MATLISARPDSVAQYLNPLTLVRRLWRQRDLIGQFTRREIEGRYRASFLGLFWSFINPLVLLLIYTFVFGVIFKSKWPNAKTDSLAEFAITLFCGLITFNIFSECVGKAATMVTTVPNYVKKVVFPLEILPISALGTALFHASISFGILLVVDLLFIGIFQWTIILLPLVILPMLFLTLGLTWFLASLGVFIRDIGYTVTLVVQVLFFLTPVFYSLQNIPEPYRDFIGLNPMTQIVENSRRVVLWGLLPDWSSLVGWIIATSVIMVLGYTWFMKTKKAFADVL